MKPMVVPLVAGLVLAVAAPGLADPASDAALIQAVYDGDLRRMQVALRQGASFNARDENGYTPLHWAAFRGYGVLAGYMVDRGAQVDVPDRNGYTPLMLAAWNGHETVVRQLLARGASRDRRSADDFTAWDYARSKNHDRLLPWLVPTRRLPAYKPSRPRQPTPQPLPSDDEVWTMPTNQASPKPTPAPGGPANEFTVVAGMHLSRISFPIVGLHYRRSLHDWFSLRLGAEYGQTTATRTGALDLGFTRLHAALLTNGWFYVGGGATQSTLGTLYAGGYNPAVTAGEAIAGLKLSLGPATLGTEFRFGVGGPSTATGGLGIRF